MNQKINTKALAAKSALDFVKEGMQIGLGTGSTVDFFLQFLAEKFHKGLNITAVATSKQTEKRAQELGIPISDINSIYALDLVIDGADEVDNEKRLIKGAGGALLREKIVAHLTKNLIIIVDDSKVSTSLGKSLLPIEVIPFAYQVTQREIEKLGLVPKLRQKNDSVYLTDNGNYIFDCKCSSSPAPLDVSLHAIPGIVETGLFIGYAKTIIIGHNDGQIEIR